MKFCENCQQLRGGSYCERCGLKLTDPPGPRCPNCRGWQGFTSERTWGDAQGHGGLWSGRPGFCYLCGWELAKPAPLRPLLPRWLWEILPPGILRHPQAIILVWLLGSILLGILLASILIHFIRVAAEKAPACIVDSIGLTQCSDRETFDQAIAGGPILFCHFDAPARTDDYVTDSTKAPGLCHSIGATWIDYVVEGQFLAGLLGSPYSSGAYGNGYLDSQQPISSTRRQAG